MKTFIKELTYKGCREDFLEDKISSNIAITFDIFVSFLGAFLITLVCVLTNSLDFIVNYFSQEYYGVFGFFVTVYVGLMVILYLPSYNFQSKYLMKKEVTRPFYFIMELDKDNIELKVDFDKDHRRTNKQYKINLNTVEGVGVYTKQLALSDDRFIRNGDFVKPADNPDIQFVKIDTNKVGSLSNIGDRKISYIVPRYDDKGTDMLLELYGLLEK